MSIKEVRSKWSNCELDFVKEFVIHSESEVADLPKCCVGSTAIVCETGNRYVCCRDGSWKPREVAIEEDPGESGGNTGGGVSSWNDLTDKPFGEQEVKDIVYVENGMVLGIPSGSKIIAEYDGVPYSVTLKTWTESGGFECFEIGDEAFSTLPFYVYGSLLWGESTQDEEIRFADGGEHQLEVYGIQIAYVPLDEKYIPKSIARVENIPEHTWESLPDKPFYGEEAKTIVAETTVEYGSSISFNNAEYGECIAVFDGIEYPAVFSYYWDENSWSDSCKLEFTTADGYSVVIYGCDNGATDVPNGSHTIAAYVPGKIVHLDAQFLPKAAAVSDVAAAPTAEQFNALLASLRNAGYLAT